MRVVSQDGSMDYPYDKSVIFLNQRNKKDILFVSLVKKNHAFIIRIIHTPIL